MAADDSHTLEGALRTLRKAVKGQHQLEGAVRELEEVATAMDDEATRATLPARLDAVCSPSHPAQALLLAHPAAGLAVLAGLLERVADGLKDMLGRGTSKGGAAARERELEGWARVGEGLARVMETFLDDDDESTRAHQPTSEEKEHFGNTCLPVLATLLKSDLEAAFLPPSLLRKVFDLFSAATAHHPSNKTRLSNLATLGPHALAAILSSAADSELTANAFELAFRLGDHVGRQATSKGSKTRWLEHVFPEKAFGKEAKKLREKLAACKVGTYQKESPAILAILSGRDLSKYQLFTASRLTVAGELFSHPDAPSRAASSGDFDGPIAFNRLTFTATVSAHEAYEGDVLEQLLECAWKTVQRVEVEEGKAVFIVRLNLSAPPTIDGKGIAVKKDAPLVVDLTLPKSDLPRLKDVLKLRSLPAIAHPTTPSSRPPSHPGSKPPSKTRALISAPKEKPVSPWSVLSDPVPVKQDERKEDGGAIGKAKPGKTATADALGEGGCTPAAASKKAVDLEGKKVDEGVRGKKRSPPAASPPPAKKRALPSPPPAAQPFADEKEEGGADVAGAADEEEDDEADPLRALEVRFRGMSKREAREVVRRLFEKEAPESSVSDARDLRDGGQEEDGGEGEREMQLDAPAPLAAAAPSAVETLPPPSASRLASTSRPTSLQPLPSLRFAYETTTEPTMPRVTFDLPSAPAQEKGLGVSLRGEQETRESVVEGDGHGKEMQVDEAEKEVKEVLGELSEILLTRYTSHRLDAAAHLTQEQASFSYQLRALCFPFVSESDALLHALRESVSAREPSSSAGLGKKAAEIAKKSKEAVGRAARGSECVCGGRCEEQGQAESRSCRPQQSG